MLHSKKKAEEDQQDPNNQEDLEPEQIKKAEEAIRREEMLEETQYMVRERGYGAGDVRINTHIDVDEDIYSLGFATAIKDDVLNRYFDVFKGELVNLSDESDSSDDSDEGE